MFHGNNENKSLKIDLRCDLIVKPRSMEWSIQPTWEPNAHLLALIPPFPLRNSMLYFSHGLAVAAATPLVNYAAEPTGFF